jgi:hypothetical protein
MLSKNLQFQVTSLLVEFSKTTKGIEDTDLFLKIETSVVQKLYECIQFGDLHLQTRLLPLLKRLIETRYFNSFRSNSTHTVSDDENVNEEQGENGIGIFCCLVIGSILM